MMEPVAIAAVFPFINILAFEGAAIKVLGQNGLDLGHLVEGLGEVFGRVTVVEGEVDAVAKGAGETGDFAVAVTGEVVEGGSGGRADLPVGRGRAGARMNNRRNGARGAR